MSHFCAMVVHKKDQDIADLLAPYDEGIVMEPYIDLTREEAIKSVRESERRLEVLRKNLNKADDYQPTDEECYQYMADMYDDDRKDAEGNLYSTYNPKSKWDYWGACQYDDIIFKPGVNPNDYYEDEGYPMDAIDFSDNKEKYKEAERFWEIVVENSPLKEGEEEPFSFWKPEYYLRRYKTKEGYADCIAKFASWAVVTPDGEWHEPGKVGWFGMSDETDEEYLDWVQNFRSRFIEPFLNDDYFVAFVDCHI